MDLENSNKFGSAIQNTKEAGQISLLLPFYLDDSFSMVFEKLGFKVLWAETQQELEKLIEPVQIDLAVEWQRGQRDFTIRNLLERYNKDAKIFLALNWNGKMPPDFDDLGYVDVLTYPVKKVPIDLKELKIKFYNALPTGKKRIFEQLPIWNFRGVLKC